MEQRRGRLAARRVHAHVERAGAAVGKAAGGIIDLRAGDADVGEDGIDTLDTFRGEDLVDAGEVGVVKGEVAADGFELDAGEGDVRGVEVQGDEVPVGLDAAEQL